MEPKTIYIDGSFQIQKWADENSEVIMQCLYDNVFDFVKNKEEVRVVLKLVTGGDTKRRGRLKPNGYNIEFTISQDDIQETIDNLLEHMTKIEEYERCSKLAKLKTQINTNEVKELTK